ncbi:DDE-type integrase/transposase/recombinase [Phaeobacter sp. J2-8]|uniref:DDE-type integrase/transposase/recombinase n=1 Tax=Phaeobacter sp. J2-8 TaxID=2931394 RepID=UPI001FD111D5|nr:DDE-type integrase/transposase/recombinase [Phaeobacter sp. J2-8]MCJ7874854.1 DDE-type integrase/transposase/recombinase [Phaeobacter sp. J2-8]
MAKRTVKHLHRASFDWYADKTYIGVAGKWHDLWRAIDATGQMIDFRHTARRDARAARALLNKAIAHVRLNRPVTIVTDEAHSDRRAIREINHKLPSVKREIEFIRGLFESAA